MDLKDKKAELEVLFYSIFHKIPEHIKVLPRSGSSRIYFRIHAGDTSAIGTYNEDIDENEAFFSFTNTFLAKGLPVPKLYAVSKNKQIYLQEDLGSETLLDYVNSVRKKGDPVDMVSILKPVLIDLINFQVNAGQQVDYSKCYPRPSFDRQSILWDLQYFKYMFLKIADISFNEQQLEDDFQTLAKYLTKQKDKHFMYRDFQVRNIMYRNNQAYYIDYQGGRKGPVQYDLASLLYSPKTALRFAERAELIDFYCKQLNEIEKVNMPAFEEKFYMIALVRIFQALGAYGYRGLHEGKANFRPSIPLAIRNLRKMKSNQKITLVLPEIEKVIDRLAASSFAKPYVIPNDKLTIRISSFSYKNGIPEDPSENGGGFVFDCRGLPNPGRLPEYRNLCGLDEPVVKYLEQHKNIHYFFESIQAVLKTTIENYLERKFTHLCINFGCTGGQHRSVYNAERMAQWIGESYNNIILHVQHRERKNWVH